MARVSKEELSSKQIEDLFRRLNRMLTKLSARGADDFLSELLGKEERIMLAKRLAIIVMVFEGHSLYKVAQTLHVSTATADKVKRRMRRHGYDRIISHLKKDTRNYMAVLTIIDSVLHLGGALPRYTGKDRYRALKNLSID